jgi:hypothetical protein
VAEVTWTGLDELLAREAPRLEQLVAEELCPELEAALRPGRSSPLFVAQGGAVTAPIVHGFTAAQVEAVAVAKLPAATERASRRLRGG